MLFQLLLLRTFQSEVWARVVMDLPKPLTIESDLTFLYKILQTYCTPLPSSHKKVQFVDKSTTIKTAPTTQRPPATSMGRFRRGHRNRKGGGKNRSNHGGSTLTEADWMLVEKYLLEYQSRAYEVYKSKTITSKSQHDTSLHDTPVMIGGHQL